MSYSNNSIDGPFAHFNIRSLFIFDRGSTPRCCCIQSSSDAKGPTSNVTLQPITSTKKRVADPGTVMTNVVQTRQSRQSHFPLPLRYSALATSCNNAVLSMQ